MDKRLMQQIAIGFVTGYLVLEYIKAKSPELVAAVNPADPDNLVNKSVSKGIKTASGGKFLSLGDFLFTIFNPNAPGERRVTLFGTTEPKQL